MSYAFVMDSINHIHHVQRFEIMNLVILVQILVLTIPADVALKGRSSKCTTLFSVRLLTLMINHIGSTRKH